MSPRRSACILMCWHKTVTAIAPSILSNGFPPSLLRGKRTRSPWPYWNGWMKRILSRVFYPNIPITGCRRERSPIRWLAISIRSIIRVFWNIYEKISQLRRTRSRIGTGRGCLVASKHCRCMLTRRSRLFYSVMRRVSLKFAWFRRFTMHGGLTLISRRFRSCSRLTLNVRTSRPFRRPRQKL